MDDLDELLDSALDDFQKVDIPQSSGATSSSSSRGPIGLPKEIVAQQSQGDQPGPSGSDEIPGEQLGLGLGLGLPGLATAGKKKAAKGKGRSSSSADGTTSSRAAVARELGMPPPEGPLSATLQQLAEQTRETVGNIDAVDDDKLGDELVENLMKQFEDLGGSQDMQSIMDTMMRQLLSKEVLHEPMKEIGERYPEWLAANKSQIREEDYNRYSRQHQYILQLCDVYESTPDDFQKIMDLMQSMQNCGQPPSDIVKELAPGLDLDRDGQPMLPDFSALGSGGPPNCSIM
ncbi:unnamed protein product [Calypogeia fissa]